MSLHARFLLLLSLLGAAVIANIGVTVWSVGLLDREQRQPVQQIGAVLGVLNDLKRTLWEQAGEIGFFVLPSDAAQPQTDNAVITADRIDRYAELGDDALVGLNEFAEEANEFLILRAGANTVENLRSRMKRVNALAESLEGQRASSPEAQSAASDLYNLHEFIERLEARLIEEATLSVAYAERMQRRLLLTLGVSVLTVLITLAAAAWLFRRWVILRIDRLRVAAERIGQGDFEHRVPVEGSDELDRVSSQINEMTSTIVSMQAERIERERLAAVGDMARRLAHNIRNPLGGIRSLAELSEQECAPDDPVRDHQRRIMRTVDQFSRWLNDLLSVSNPLAVEPREEIVTDWISRLADSHRPLAESRAVTLEVDLERAPAAARFDRRHMEHTLSALLTNAIEVSPSGGSVALRVEHAQESSEWSLEVSDQGPGIPEAHLEQLFTPYFTTKTGGTGIGLAQALRVVRQHGGRIEVRNLDSEPSKGSGAAFRVTLPLDPSGEVATIGQNGETDCGQNPATRGRRNAAVHDRAGPRAGGT